MPSSGTGVISTMTVSSTGKDSKRSEKASVKSTSRAEHSRKPIVYEPFEVTIATVETTVKLLTTDEPEVFERVLASLNAFIGRNKEHLVVLRDLDIVEPLMKSMDHSNECIRRYGLKILAELCEYPEIVKTIRASTTVIETLCALLGNEANDKVIFEFSSEILSAVGGNFGTVRMLQTNLVDALIPRLRNPDPDVQKNCLEVLIHILRDPIGADALVASPTFALCPILKLCTSEYEAVQRLALRALEYLSKRTTDTALMAQFVKEKVMDVLMAVLEQIDWGDLHHLALASIKNYCDSEENVEQFFHSNVLTRLVRFTEVIERPDIVECALEVLVRIAQLPGGRQICIDVEVPQLLIYYLKEDYAKAAETACIGLTYLVSDPKVFDLMVESEVAKDLLRIIQDETRSWEIRNVAASALFAMMKRDKKVVDQVYENDGTKVFCGLLNQEKHPPLETLFTAIHCIEQMTHYEDIRSKMLSEAMIDALLVLLTSKARNYFRLMITALQCLSTLMNEKVTRDWFISGKGVEIIVDILKELSIPLKLEAVAVIRQLANDEILASAFIGAGALEMLLAERPLRKKYPIWEAAIEALFKSNLSAKFAYTGRLDFEDITKDNFYLTERVEKKFTVLESLLDERVTPTRPIFFANFKQPPQPPPPRPRRRRSIRPPRKPAKVSELAKKLKKASSKPGSAKGSKTRVKSATSVTKSITSKTSAANSLTKTKRPKSASPSMRSIESVDGRKNRRSKRMLKRLASKLAKTGQTSLLDVNVGPNNEQLKAVIAAKYGVTPPDYNLYFYLKDLKEKIVEPVHKYWYEAKVINVPDLVVRAKVLAVFVDSCMKGAAVEETEEVLRHKHELHLQELRRQSGTNVIPVGHVRVGLHLERAMLFKVLADRIGLPCALQRGEYGRMWVEVAVPEPITSVNPDEEDWELPTSMLRPNFVVDLMKDIGNLMPIGGAEANAYCNIPGIYDYPLEFQRPTF